MTATSARIRRCNRPYEYAVAQSMSVLAARPDAKPVGDEGFTRDSFFDRAVHAQVLQNELFALVSQGRISQAVETQVPLHIGIDVPVAPRLPRVRMIDRTRGINRTMIVSGLAVDHNAERNSIEALG